MAKYSVAQARDNLPKLIDRALAGEEVQITRRGEVVARLAPSKPVGVGVDVEWLERNRVRPASGSEYDSTAAIRRMRDEGY